MNEQEYDIVVIGGGSGGYAAARTARDCGATVAIVEHGPLGGLCILKGCMPSKTLLASADAAQRVREAHRFGITAGAPEPDMPAVIARKRRLIEEFASYRREGLEEFPLFRGRATFISQHEITVGETDRLRAKSFVIATGSSISPAPIAGLDETGYITSDDILDLAQLPKSAIVLGGGYIATELGQYLHRMGVRTQFLLRASHVLSNEDTDVGNALTEALREEGIEIQTGVMLSHAEKNRDGRKSVVYHVNGQEHRASADEIVMCLGRSPNCADLGLEAIGVDGHHITGIKVNDHLQTNVPHIYAIGDVTVAYALVHVAIAQGEIAARHACGKNPAPIDYRLLKSHTVFTEPQVAVTGHTERELEKAGTPFMKASYLFADHGKAMTLERTHGFVKILAAPDSGEILGAAVVGAEASELIHELTVAMHFRATVRDFMQIPHLHPTLAEIWTYPAEELAEKMTVPA